MAFDEEDIDDDDIFANFEYERNGFEQIENPKHPLPDVCAFLMLYELCQSMSGDMIRASEHDIIYLEASVEEVKKNATIDQLRDLYRCGVCHDTDLECFIMYT